MKKIIVLGGGTAGMLTGLFCQRVFPQAKIQLIKSDKVGILGAGEGSTPNINTFLSFLDIDPLKLLTKTNGTIKHGISFENWSGDNKKYFHSFNETGFFNVNNIFSHGTYEYYLKYLLNNKKKYIDHRYSSKLVYKNNIDLVNLGWAMHFDARLLADALETIFIARGGTVIIGEYKKLNKTNQKITGITLSNNKSYTCSFMFDCSGFARLINGKEQKDTFTSFKNTLPIKRAIPFFLKSEKEIKPYTQAIAMKYGWVWKIPLQHRIGAGYIFDTDYITDDQAREEVSSMFKEPIDFIRPINFEAGRYDHPWINNCISVGLSYSFTEPLEATSIYLTIQQLEVLLHHIPNMYSLDQSDISSYNSVINNSFDKIVDFLYLHYLGKRKDTLFWKEFSIKNKAPDSLQRKLERMKYNLNHFDFTEDKPLNCFDVKNYLEIGEGLGLINKINQKGIVIIEPSFKDYMNLINNNLKNSKNHKLALEIIKTGKET